VTFPRAGYVAIHPLHFLKGQLPESSPEAFNRSDRQPTFLTHAFFCNLRLCSDFKIPISILIFFLLLLPIPDTTQFRLRLMNAV
jgi:hypothetical protein